MTDKDARNDLQVTDKESELHLIVMKEHSLLEGYFARMAAHLEAAQNTENFKRIAPKRPLPKAVRYAIHGFLLCWIYAAAAAIYIISFFFSCTSLTLCYW